MKELSQKKLDDNCLDIIRIMCAFTIFLGHFILYFKVNNRMLHVVSNCIRGVPVFFFLSGLFIARSLERYTIKEYIKKRVFRIFPELWVCVLLNLLIILVSIKEYSFHSVLEYLFTQLTFLQFYTPSEFRTYGVGVPNGALWTMSVDIQFYFIAIFLRYYFRENRGKKIIFLITVSIILDFIAEHLRLCYPEIVYKLLSCSVLPFLWIFLLGMGIYYYFNRVINAVTNLRLYFIVLYIIWQYMVPDEVISIFNGVRYNIITTFLLIILICGIGFSYKFRLKRDCTYSFYLYHMVVINVIFENITKSFVNLQEMLIFFFISFIIIVILSIVSNYFISYKLSTKIIDLIDKRNSGNKY